MIAVLKKTAKKVGVDGAVFYTILLRVTQGVGGILSVFFIARYLSQEEQGYYYTFGSILTLQVFFELGLSSIITQYVAHEMAHLHWASRISLIGAIENQSRLASLLRFCVKWFLIVAILLTILLLIAGSVFFNHYRQSDTVVWQVPWIVLVINTSLNLFVCPILAFLEGLGKVKEVAILRLYQQISQSCFLYLFLTIGFKLYAGPVATIIGSLTLSISILFPHRRALLKHIWASLDAKKIDYWQEIFPYQWRLALSWISGYFIYQLFNPVLFAIEGPIVAGRMGMTLSALGSILNLSAGWMNARIPTLSRLIAKREYTELDRLFQRNLYQSTCLCIIALLGFVFSIGIFRYLDFPVSNRFLPWVPLLLLCSVTLINQVVFSLSTYVRCHKQEPFLVKSIVMAILTTASTLVLGNKFGLLGIVWGYFLLISIVSLTWVVCIFNKKKVAWHS